MSKWLVIIFIFLFSISLRLWNLNAMGRTWDEGAQIEQGYEFIELLKHGDFQNSYWYNHPDHPPLTKYFYGIASYLDIKSFTSNGKPVFRYDWQFARLVSVLFSSLSVVLVAMFGWKYYSPFVGITGGIILSMLPFFLGLSQIATIESILMFFFTSTVFYFINFLEKFSIKYTIVAGLSLGAAVLTKYTNILLIPLLIIIYALWVFSKNIKRKRVFFRKELLYMCIVTFLTIFFLWPMPWFHLKEFINFNYVLRFVQTSHSVPEVFFGKLLLVPKVYYAVYFFITTPFFILILFFIGLKVIDVKKTWILLVLVIWFIFPFIQSLYNFKQHGLRYIIEVYAPLALIAAIGFDYAASKITKNILFKSVLFLPIVIYLFLILIKITPYYLEYFNIVVGGTKNVYEKKLFQMGWWGQGIKEGSNYLINNAPENSRIGYAISPINSLPPLAEFNVKEYEDGQQYDYVIVNYFHVLREGFDDSNIKVNYKEVYNVKVDGAHLVTVYKRK